VSVTPGPNEPGGGSHRSQTPPPGDAVPTVRLSHLRHSPQQVVSQAREQAARGQRTRRTVDLPVATHRALDIWQRDAADRLGVARVTGQEVLAALVDQLLVDPKLAAQITRAIQARR
jgi:hypothetical protein